MVGRTRRACCLEAVCTSRMLLRWNDSRTSPVSRMEGDLFPTNLAVYVITRFHCLYVRSVWPEILSLYCIFFHILKYFLLWDNLIKVCSLFGPWDVGTVGLKVLLGTPPNVCVCFRAVTTSGIKLRDWLSGCADCPIWDCGASVAQLSTELSQSVWEVSRQFHWPCHFPLLKRVRHPHWSCEVYHAGPIFKSVFISLPHQLTKRNPLPSLI